MTTEQEYSIDDVWVNGLAQRIGVLTAQNDRLQIENERLRAELQKLQPSPDPLNLNGEKIQEPIT